MFARVLNTPLYFDESFMIAHLWKKTFHEKQVKNLSAAAKHVSMMSLLVMKRGARYSAIFHEIFGDNLLKSVRQNFLRKV